MYVSFAYSGWNAAAYIAGEVEKPEKTLPRALLLGTGIVMVLYMLLNVVYFYAVRPTCSAGPTDRSSRSSRSAHAAAARCSATRGGKLITSLIALALVSAVSAMMMAGPRVYAAMAADRALPRQLAWYPSAACRRSPSSRRACSRSCSCIVGDLGALIRFVGFTLAVFAALTVGALFIFRARGLKGAYQTFGYPVTPIAFIAVSAWIAYAQFKQNPKELPRRARPCSPPVGSRIMFLVKPRRRRSRTSAKLPEARIRDE